MALQDILMKLTEGISLADPINPNPFGDAVIGGPVKMAAMGRLAGMDPLANMFGTDTRGENLGNSATLTRGRGINTQMPISTMEAIAHKLKSSGDKKYRILGSYKRGTTYVPQTGAYKLHEGEAVLSPEDAWYARVLQRDKELELQKRMEDQILGKLVTTGGSEEPTPMAAYDVPEDMQGQYGTKYLTNRMMPEQSYTPTGGGMEAVAGALGLNVPGGNMAAQEDIDWSSLVNDTPTYAQPEGWTPEVQTRVPLSNQERMQSIAQMLQSGLVDKGTADVMMQPFEIAQRAADRQTAQAANIAAQNQRQQDKLDLQRETRDEKLRLQSANDEASMKALTSGLDRMESTANQLLTENLEGVKRIAGASGYIPGYGDVVTMRGSKGADAKARLESLKSKIGFEVLQEMRNNSKTGGALGQVSDFENKLLQQAIDNLDAAQDDKQLIAAIQNIKDETARIKTRYQEAYQKKWGGGEATSAPAQVGRFKIKEIK